MSTPNFETLATKEFVKDEIDKVKSEIHRVELKLEQSIAELTRRMYKSIYVANAIQYLAMVGTIIGIISFIIKK